MRFRNLFFSPMGKLTPKTGPQPRNLRRIPERESLKTQKSRSGQLKPGRCGFPDFRSAELATEYNPGYGFKPLIPRPLPTPDIPRWQTRRPPSRRKEAPARGGDVFVWPHPKKFFPFQPPLSDFIYRISRANWPVSLEPWSRRGPTAFVLPSLIVSRNPGNYRPPAWAPLPP